MIATISFTSMAEWVIGAYIAGCASGFVLYMLLYIKNRK
jgi:hypothetical protein